MSSHNPQYIRAQSAICAPLHAEALSLWLGVGIVFAIVFVLGLLFLIYASRRARREDREAAAANVGRWKEVSEVDVPTVPKAPKLRGRPSWQGLANPAEPILATITHTLPSQVVDYERMVSHGTGQQVNNPYRDARAIGSQHKDLPAVPRSGERVKAEWDGVKRDRSRERKPERGQERDRSNRRRTKEGDRIRSSAREGRHPTPSSSRGRIERRRSREDSRRTRRR